MVITYPRREGGGTLSHQRPNSDLRYCDAACLSENRERMSTLVNQLHHALSERHIA